MILVFSRNRQQNQVTWEGIWGRNFYLGKEKEAGPRQRGQPQIMGKSNPCKGNWKGKTVLGVWRWRESVLVHHNLVLSNMPHMFSDWLCIICALYVVSMWSVMMNPKYESWRLSLEGAELHTCSQGGLLAWNWLSLLWTSTDLKPWQHGRFATVIV